MNDPNQTFQNTDRNLYQEKDGSTIHVTEHGGIGINCRGHVIVALIEKWHECGEKLLCVDPDLPSWRWKLAMKLLRWDNWDARKKWWNQLR